MPHWRDQDFALAPHTLLSSPHPFLWDPRQCPYHAALGIWALLLPEGRQMFLFLLF